MCEAVEKIYNQAKAEGYAIGYAKGIAKCKREIASRMLAMNFSVELIAEATDLAVEEVEGLKKSA